MAGALPVGLRRVFVRRHRVSDRPWIVNLLYGALATVASSVSLVAARLGRFGGPAVSAGSEPQAVATEPAPPGLPGTLQRGPVAPKAEGRSMVSRLLRLSRSYRRAEQARSQLVAIVESSSDAIIGMNLSGQISSWNRGASKLFGHSAKEALGKSIDSLIPLAGGEEFQSVLARIRRGERIDSSGRIWFRKDGSPVHVSLSVSPIKDGWGRVIGAATIARDISDHVRVQEDHRFLLEVDRLLASSLDHETILSGVADLAVGYLADGCAADLVGEDGRLRQVAVAHRDPLKLPAARELHREASHQAGEMYCMPSVIRTGVPQVYPDVPEAILQASPEDRETLGRYQALCIQSAMVLPMTARGRTLGAIALVSAEGGRRYDESDLALAEELAHRVALALDNVRLFEDAQKAIRVRDEFLSVAAHELRTPVTSLHGFAQFALRQLDRGGPVDPQRIRQGLQVIDYQSKKLSHLVSQLLSVLAIEGGSLAIDRQLVDLTRMLEGVVALVRTGTSGHRLAVQAPPSMPAVVDPLRFEQVIVNVLDNAIKYSPDGGDIEIVLSAPDPDSVMLSVRDHGIGVPPEHLDMVFERLYRGHDVDNFSGMGLGLYISREVVRRHGGEIRLESPPDGGTLCVVTLPTGLRSVEPSAEEAA
jgi:PAS domain S-box-containing protein